MGESQFRRYYHATEFAALAGEMPVPAQFKTHLSTIGLGTAVAEVRAVDNLSIVVEWADFPALGDVALVNAAVASYAAVGASEELLERESLGITAATTAALVTVIEATTPPRAAGSYRVDFCALVGMLATVANTGVRGVFTVTRTQGADVKTRQWEHNHALQQPQTFSGGRSFKVEHGATISVKLEVGKVGAAAATAQMASAVVTIDKIG